ncbi:MAG: hypothetical protein LC792_06745 [Actinobacteria bacterium]|nr:hypothetical protein [Actinomycetota bacterium]
MRRLGIILAGAALALASVVPVVASVADAHGRGGRHERHGHDHGGYHRGGRCYGCDGPGSRCGRYGCDYAYPGYYGGYYGGGYGCNFDYPCGEPRQYDCTKYRGPDGQAAQDPQCKYDQRCGCYYHGSQPPPEAGSQPAPPDQGAQPAPDQGQQPPDQGAEPPPDQGGDQPRPY